MENLTAIIEITQKSYLSRYKQKQFLEISMLGFLRLLYRATIVFESKKEQKIVRDFFDGISTNHISNAILDAYIDIKTEIEFLHNESTSNLREQYINLW